MIGKHIVQIEGVSKKLEGISGPEIDYQRTNKRSEDSKCIAFEIRTSSYEMVRHKVKASATHSSRKKT
jgi:hypothetical protein